jgi:hypothetical protein
VEMRSDQNLVGNEDDEALAMVWLFLQPNTPWMKICDMIRISKARTSETLGIYDFFFPFICFCKYTISWFEFLVFLFALLLLILVALAFFVIYIV